MESKESYLQHNQFDLKQTEQSDKSSINNQDDDDKRSENITTIKLKYKSSQNRVYHDFYKTKICPLFTLATCHRGDKCPFAHSENELREKPNLIKTKICEAFLQGMCKSSDQCPFAHGESELRSTPDFFKTALCQLWRQGKCTSGETCRFAHGLYDLRPMPFNPKTKKKQYNKIFENGFYPNQFIPIPQVQTQYIPIPNYELLNQYYPYGSINYYENYSQIPTFNIQYDINNNEYNHQYESIAAIPTIPNTNILYQKKDTSKSVNRNSKKKKTLIITAMSNNLQ